MKNEHKVVLNEEAPFDISELFFSTTDRKGIIRTLNDVFLRVAGFSSEELITKPHNTIRHPDMPRCVFFLLWDYLLAGKAIGAYVKNISKTGQYYWVFALASPIDDSLISVRLKPSSTTFPVVRKLYSDLLTLEKSYGADWREGMKASAAELMKQLKNLGFNSYDDFMSAALREEMLSRDAAMSAKAAKAERAEESTTSPLSEKARILKQVFDNLEELLQLRNNLRAKESFFLSLGSHMAKVALNASVRAAHLAEEGRSLSVISEEVSHISRDIGTESEVLKARSADLAKSLGEISFFVAQAILQLQALMFFESEMAQKSISEPEQIARYGAKVSTIGEQLNRCIEGSTRRSIDGVTALRQSFAAFEDISDSLEKILLTIQFSYVTGKTLTAKINAGEQFSALLADMVSLSESARTEIINLKGAVGGVKRKVSRWQLSSLAG